MEFTVVNKDGGILSSGICPESMVDSQAWGGNFVVKGMRADPCTQKYNFSTKSFEDCPASKANVLASDNRARRNIALNNTDWIELPSNINHPKYNAIMAYRKAVKDECKRAISINVRAEYPKLP